MRRLVPPALAALVLLTGCGMERPAPVRAADASVSPRPETPAQPPAQTPTPTPTPTPTRTPTSTPSRTNAPDGPLAGFPLDLDYARENGDDHSPVVVTAEPGVGRIDLCRQVARDPHAGTTDVIGRLVAIPGVSKGTGVDETASFLRTVLLVR